MNPELVSSLIDNLAQKLEIPVTQIMLVLPRIGYKSMVITFLLLFMTFLCFFLMCFFAYLELKTKNTSEFDFSVLIVICAAVLLPLLLITLSTLPSALLWLHDPEAWAYDYLFNKF